VYEQECLTSSDEPMKSNQNNTVRKEKKTEKAAEAEEVKRPSSLQLNRTGSRIFMNSSS